MKKFNLKKTKFIIGGSIVLLIFIANLAYSHFGYGIQKNGILSIALATEKDTGCGKRPDGTPYSLNECGKREKISEQDFTCNGYERTFLEIKDKYKYGSEFFDSLHLIPTGSIDYYMYKYKYKDFYNILPNVMGTAQFLNSYFPPFHWDAYYDIPISATISIEKQTCESTEDKKSGCIDGTLPDCSDVFQTMVSW